MQKPQEVTRKWYIVDAEGVALGRLASQVASILKGKNKPEYTPNVDCGDYVIVINTDKVVLTGKKMEQKFYRHHSGYVGGLKEVGYDKIMKEKSDFAMQLAVKGMIPDTTLGRKQLTRCRIYKNAEHKHEAQKPVAYEL